MPIYEYGCEACGHQFEISQKLADAPLKTCPDCGKDELRKLISATSFVLKGGGWYKDGYGSASGKKPERTENQRTDRLQKAIDDDKKKAGAPSSSDSSPSTSTSSSDSPSASTTTSSSSDKAAAGS